MGLVSDPKTLMSAHARYAAHAAAACGYVFRSLDGADGYLFEVRAGLRRAIFAAGQGSPYALNDANAASLARDKSFCAEVLRAAGLPVLPGRLFFVTKRWAEMRSSGREPEDARMYAERAQYPLFCKPISASNGLHAEIIDDAAAFGDYMSRVAREHFAILAQPYVRGAEHRVFVLRGRALFSYRKHQPNLVGDGRSTLGALMVKAEIEGKRQARDETGALVALDAVPAYAAQITLEGPANRSAGGGAGDLVDGAATPLAELAVRAVDALGLKLAGVDIFDVSPGRDLSDLVIIEANSNPMIATLEDHDRWDLIDEIWRANFDAALR